MQLERSLPTRPHCKESAVQSEKPEEPAEKREDAEKSNAENESEPKQEKAG